VNVRSCELYSDTKLNQQAPLQVSEGRRCSERETGRREKAENDTGILEVRKMAVCCVVGRGFVLRPLYLVKRSRETRFIETAMSHSVQRRFVNAKMSVLAVT